MRPPLFRYDQEDIALFFDLVYRANRTRISEKDVFISEPYKENDILTSVIISAKPISRLTGSTKVFYNRLSLNRFFFGVPLSVTDIDDITPETISQKIKERWCVYLNPDEILLRIDCLRKNHPTRVKIIAKPTSLIWTGEIEVWVLPEGYLGELFDQLPLSFNDGNVKRNAYLYSIEYSSDGFEPGLDEGFRFHSNTTVTEPFLEQLRESTEDPWQITYEESPFNLRDAQVVYVGPWTPDNPSATVTVIHLDKYCKNLFGFLIIYHTLTDISQLITICNLNGFSE